MNEDTRKKYLAISEILLKITPWLKTLDTIGNYQRLVFTVGVSHICTK